jgi:hypothetical protein
LKHGRTTGWQAGRSYEDRSDCKWADGRVSTEWCILDIDNESTVLDRSFSKGGDSGVAVIDFEGRLVGMLRRGNADHMMTWATPQEWLFKSVEVVRDTKVEVLIGEEEENSKVERTGCIW